MRFTGTIEPSILKSDSKTVFRQRIADDAFELLLGAEFAIRDGFDAFGSSLLQRAGGIFQQMFGKDLVPAELPAKLIPSGE